MKKELTADIAVIGGGILGLAHAYMALKDGFRVVLFERDAVALGASIRNFGLIWPIGQQPGKQLERALRSRHHWTEVASGARLWFKQNGSLHLAYHDDELAVLEEFAGQHGREFSSTMLTANQVAMRSLTAMTHSLKGGLFSEIEGTVNPREAVRTIPKWLEETFGLVTRFGHGVKGIEMPHVLTDIEKWRVEHVIVCSGSDFSTLYPQVLEQAGLIKCKLQMMKGLAGGGDFPLGPTLCAGLTLRHYKAFSQCPSLKAVSERYDRDMPRMHEHGIHVLLGQNNHGELIIGDSHQYGRDVSPFDSEEINDLIIGYLKTFAHLPDLRIVERWHGVYPKHPSTPDFVTSPEPGVLVVNGLGGAGMTLSFGLAEEVIDTLDAL